MKREELERIRVMAEEDQVSLLELARQLPALLAHIAEQDAKIERLRECSVHRVFPEMVKLCAIPAGRQQFEVWCKQHDGTDTAGCITSLIVEPLLDALKEAQDE